jgi:hypothetical protein
MTARHYARIRFIARHFNNLQGLRYGVPLGLIILSGGGTTYFENPTLVLLRLVLFSGAVLLIFGVRQYYTRSFGEVEPQPVHPVEELQPLSIYSPAHAMRPRGGFQRMSPFAQRSLVVIGLALVLFWILQAISPFILIEADESLIQAPWLMLDGFLAASFEPHASVSIWQSRSTVKAVFGQLLYALCGSYFLGVWLWRERRLSQIYHLALAIPLLGLAAYGSCLAFFYDGNGELARMANRFMPAVVHLWVALFLCGTAMVLAGLLDHWQLVRALGQPRRRGREE